MIRSALSEGSGERKAAGIPIIDEYGRKIDFHSLRHTCGTRMARNGVPLAVAQKIMRHSTPTLTANLYTHVLVADKARELAKLPAITVADPENEALSMTGTEAVASLQVVENFHRPSLAITEGTPCRTGF